MLFPLMRFVIVALASLTNRCIIELRDTMTQCRPATSHYSAVMRIMVRMQVRSIGIGIMIPLMRIVILALTSPPKLRGYSPQSWVPDPLVEQDAIYSLVGIPKRWAGCKG
jgi:hypothetical protein